MNREPDEQYIAEKLTYKKESLELYLSQYESYIESKSSWQVSLSIFSTLLIAVMSSNVGWLSYKNHFELVLVFALLISGLFFIYTVIKAVRMENPAKQLKKRLYQNYINQPDRNALFVIKRVKKEQNQILVYKCKTWGCYFLPYARVDLASDIQKNIADILDYNVDDIEIHKLLEKHEISEKYHPQENIVKEYHSDYFHLYASDTFDARDITKEERFSVGKNEFEWKTLADIEADPRTRDKNQDVLNMLRKNRSDFITNISSFL